MDATGQEPQLQGEVGDSCSSVEQALRAMNDAGNVTDHATSDAAMYATSGLQNVDAKLSAKEQEIAQLREQLECDKGTAEQDISRLKTQLQATRMVLCSRPANVAKQLKVSKESSSRINRARAKDSRYNFARAGNEET